MPTIRTHNRRVLYRRLARLDEQIGPRPHRGWVRAIRLALGLSTAELAARMGISQPRVVQIERAEVTGTLQLATLERAAQALECSLCYVLVPRVPLEQMAGRNGTEQVVS